jgi:hypothetical protein
MEDLKLLLIDRLQQQGIEPDDLPLFLRDLATILRSSSEMDTAALNARLNVLGWHKAQLDYQSLQLALACVEAESAGSSAD